MSNSRKTNFDRRDFWVPDLRLRFNGHAASAAIQQDLLRIEYSDSLTQPGSCTLTLANWDGDRRNFKYLDEEVLELGQMLSLDLGYHSHISLHPVFSGKIVSVEPNFPASGIPTIQISALNLLHNFMTSPQTRVYEEMSLKDIVQQIAGRLNVKVVPPTNQRANQIQPYRIQLNQPDMLFLMQLAADYDYELFVEESGSSSKLVFKEANNINKSIEELTYPHSLIKFTPRINMESMVTSMTVSAANDLESEQGPISYTAELKDISPAMEIDVLGKRLKNQVGKIVDVPIKTKEAAKALAEGRLAQLADQVITGSGQTFGLPKLRTGSKINLRGLGQRFSRQYFVTGSTHILDADGYVTKFTARLEA